MSGWFERKEPAPGRQRRGTDLRADPDDRIAPNRRRKAKKTSRSAKKSGGSLFGYLFSRSAKKSSGAREAGSGKGRAAKAKARKPRRRSLLGGLFYWSTVAGIWGVIGIVGILAYHAAQLPPIDQLAVPKRPPNIAILASDGTLLANRGDTGGPAIHLRQLPPYLPKAFIAIEDRRFHSHWGIDPLGIARAVWRNVSGSGGLQGGSTLTQQLAKNLFLTQERTISRKIQEAILAVWLEQNYSKDQILELYLNRVYYGSGAYGVEAAAQRYFGKSARYVTLPEAAMLAGLMKAPSRLAPNRAPKAAARRAARVITAMAQEGHITENMAKLALARPANAVRPKGSGSINYAADYVMDVLDQTIGAIDRDIVVRTTIDPAIQKAGEKALNAALAKHGKKYRVSQGALVAMDPNGSVRALIGGRDYAASQYNRAVAAKRQPGSAFKPFVYLAALERGLKPDTVRKDAPINIRGWRPTNASRRYYGDVTLQRALALSLNTVAVRLALEVGPKAVVQTARRLGINAALKANASLALGTSEVTALDLVGAYAAFANGGIGVEPFIITEVRRANGRVLYRRSGRSRGRVIQPRYVSMMNSMLQQTLQTGTARRASLKGWQAAGKTGTSQNYRDGWFVGYTSHLVAGVWLGNDDSSPTRKVSGGNVPAETWRNFMQAAHAGIQPQGLPSGVWRDPSGGGPPLPPAPIPSAGAAPRDIAPRNLRPAVAARQSGDVLRPRGNIGRASSPPVPARPRDSGRPISLNPSARAIDARRRSNDLLPPASVPNSGRRTYPARDRSMLQRLIGG